MVWRAPIQLIARGLDVELEEIRGASNAELTDRDIDVAFGTIPAGTVGAVRTIAQRDRRRAGGDRRRPHHPHGERRRARMADVGQRRDLRRRRSKVIPTSCRLTLGPAEATTRARRR